MIFWAVHIVGGVLAILGIGVGVFMAMAMLEIFRNPFL